MVIVFFLVGNWGCWVMFCWARNTLGVVLGGKSLKTLVVFICAIKRLGVFCWLVYYSCHITTLPLAVEPTFPHRLDKYWTKLSGCVWKLAVSWCYRWHSDPMWDWLHIFAWAGSFYFSLDVGSDLFFGWFPARNFCSDRMYINDPFTKNQEEMMWLLLWWGELYSALCGVTIL